MIVEFRLFRAARQTRPGPSGPPSLANVGSLDAARHFDDNIILIDRHKVMLSRLNAVFKSAKFGETAADRTSSSQHEAPEFIPRGCCSNGAQVTEECVLFE
jgi:hypothetical protein